MDLLHMKYIDFPSLWRVTNEQIESQNHWLHFTQPLIAPYSATDHNFLSVHLLLSKLEGNLHISYVVS
jgi:hypothetical protein